MARTSQRPKPTPEQRAVARQRTDLLWKSIQHQRENYNESITQLASNHAKSKQWVASQLFRGGRLLATRRKKTLYNAVIHNLAKRRKEAGQSSNGRETLKELAREASQMDYENLPKEEKERLMSELCEDAADSPVVKVPKKKAGIEIESTLRPVQPELEGLAQRTGAQYLFFVTKGEVTDNWAIRVAATPKVAEACMQLFKCTPDEMAMKIEAYVMTGLSGVVHATGKKRATLLKSQIRGKIYDGLRTILSEKGVPEDEQPSTMKWAQYNELVCTHGVELEGWTEGEVRNPGDFKLVSQLERLHAALHNDPPACYWVVLDAAAWEEKKAARRSMLLSGARKNPPVSTHADQNGGLHDARSGAGDVEGNGLGGTVDDGAGRPNAGGVSGVSGSA